MEYANIPSVCRDSYIGITNTLDQIVGELAQIFDSLLFSDALQVKETKDRFPSLCSVEPRFNLIDAAFYKNQEQVPDLNCIAHYDPGLFSLSVFQTLPGKHLRFLMIFRF